MRLTLVRFYSGPGYRSVGVIARPAYFIGAGVVAMLALVFY